jgi:hypothetical protein
MVRSRPHPVRRRCASPVLIGTIVALSVGHASIAAADIPAFSYSAPATCPTQDAFAEQLARRLDAGPTRLSGTRLRVTIESVGSTFRGRVVSRDPDGAESSRELESDSCVEMVDALALLAAISVGLPATSPVTAAVPSSPPSGPNPPDADAAFRPSAPARWRVTVGGDVITTSLGGPGVQLGAQAFVQVSHDSPRTGLAPTLRATAMRTESESVHAITGGDATFTLEALGLEACPVRWQVASSASLVPCAALQAGSLEGRGQSIIDPQSTRRFSASAGASVRLEVELARWLVAEIQGGGAAPLVRHDFYFAPSDIVYSVPSVGAFGVIGLGARFP